MNPQQRRKRNILLRHHINVHNVVKYLKPHHTWKDTQEPIQEKGLMNVSNVGKPSPPHLSSLHIKGCTHDLIFVITVGKALTPHLSSLNIKGTTQEKRPINVIIVRKPSPPQVPQ